MYTMHVMCYFTALYHAWSTLHGRLASGPSLGLRAVSASGLYTQPPGYTLSLRASPLHCSLVIIMFICMLMWY